MIATISTLTLGLITAASYVRDSSLIFFTLVGLIIINLLGMAIVLKNRVIFIQKLWIVYVIESKLPESVKRFTPFGTSSFEKKIPRNPVFMYIFGVFFILLYLSLGWAAYSLPEIRAIVVSLAIVSTFLIYALLENYGSEFNNQVWVKNKKLFKEVKVKYGLTPKK